MSSRVTRGQPGHTVLPGPRLWPSKALQREPFGYSYPQAEAILDMPMGWQSADEVEHLRAERDRLTSRRVQPARARDRGTGLSLVRLNQGASNAGVPEPMAPSKV